MIKKKEDFEKYFSKNCFRKTFFEKYFSKNIFRKIFFEKNNLQISVNSLSTKFLKYSENTLIKYMAVAVAVSGGGAVAVAVAGLTKRVFNHIQKDFLINVWD